MIHLITITTTIFYYILTLGCGASLVIAYQHFKYMRFMSQLEEEEYFNDYDENGDSLYESVSVNGNYYEISKELSNDIGILDQTIKLMADDLEKKQPKSKNRKSASTIMFEYYEKARELNK